MFVRQRLAEDLVVDAEVVAADARLGNARRAAGLEDVDRLAGQTVRQPALHRPAAEPFVLKLAEPLQIRVALDFLARIPAELGRVVEPEGRAARRIEVPVDDFAHPCVERGTGGVHLL